MNKLILSIFTFIIFFSFFILEANAKTTKKKEVVLKDQKSLALRSEMRSIADRVKSLAPYVLNDIEFSKSENKVFLNGELSGLIDQFQKITTHPVVSYMGLSVSQLVIKDQFEQAKFLLNANKPEIARGKILSSLNLCISCHAQSPDRKDGQIFTSKDYQKLKLTDIDRADIMFLTRDYEDAMNLYIKVIKNLKKSDDEEKVFKALEKILIYNLKIKKDQNAALAFFTDFKKSYPQFSEAIYTEIQDWVSMLKAPPLWPNFIPLKATEEEMGKFLKNFIADEEEGPIFTPTNSSEVFDLILSSILMDYYNAHPNTTHGARILYWLAILDKRISDDANYSLADFYLIQCIEKHGDNPISKDCYDAFLEDLEINYVSGEKGQKELPKEWQEKLNNLKKYMKKQ